MLEFKDRHDYIKLLRLLADNDESHMEPVNTPEVSARQIVTATALDDFLTSYGVEYGDIDDPHFFATCRMMHEAAALNDSAILA